MENINQSPKTAATGILGEFLEQINGKNMAEQLAILSVYRDKIPNKNFSQDEKNSIIEDALSRISDDDKNKYKAFLKLMRVL